MSINKRKIPEINAGAMADISFLLLIFFLVATTMNVDSGIRRLLPPLPPEDSAAEPLQVKERNIMFVYVNRFGNVMVGEDETELSALRDKAREFIANAADDDTLPEKEEQYIDLIGTYAVSRGIISIESDRRTGYETYINVQNELTAAFNEVRDEVSARFFGGRRFSELRRAERDAVRKAVPVRISEAEPRNTE